MPYERHGMTDSPEHITWQAMKARCKFDPHYVKNGITVCSEWTNSFTQFYADMGNKPSANHSIDRINNDLGYSPDNCRWATQKEQVNNQSSNRNYTYNGVTKNLTQWAEEYHLSYQTLVTRLNRGKTIEQALNTPIQKKTPRKVA